MKNIGCLVVVGVLVLLVLWGIGSYNGLVGAQQAVESQWAQVENVYQRRADLVPNLVATVRGAANFERGTLTDVVEARARVGQVNAQATSEILNDPQKFAQFQAAQEGLSSALSRLMVVVERYPDLKSNQNFMALQSQLEGTENRIAVARRDYIETVQRYNTEIRTFPGVIWATFFYRDAKVKENFTAQPGAEQAPKVNFGKPS